MTREIDRLMGKTFPQEGKKNPQFRWDVLANEVGLEQLRKKAQDMGEDIEWARNPGLLLGDDGSARVNLYGSKGAMNTQSRAVIVFRKGPLGFGGTTEVTLFDAHTGIERTARFNAAGRRLRFRPRS